jgi:hypothetical protein
MGLANRSDFIPGLTPGFCSRGEGIKFNVFPIYLKKFSPAVGQKFIKILGGGAWGRETRIRVLKKKKKNT